jgi:TonB-linked SusC/RagA family outer membrane protein
VNENTGYGLVNNMVLDYKITKGLTAKINIGAELGINSSDSYIPKILSESSYKGSASVNNNKTLSWINENMLNYTVTLGDNHQINAVGGVTFQKVLSDGVTGSSIGYTVDGFEYNKLESGAEQHASSFYSGSSILSYLGRANYTYKNKYMFTVSGRYDGSSRLSKDNRWSFFPSGALAWRVSEESFLKDNITVSNLKLRASWGKTGSQSVAPYSSLSTFSTVNVYLDGKTPMVGYVPNSVANNQLGWENTSQFDVGVDLGLLKGSRIQFVADYYNKLTSDLLFSRLTPPSSGYTTATQNIGKVENKGFEFSLISQNFSGKFSWSTNFTLSVNRAKVVDLGKNPAGDDIKMIQSGGSFFYIIKGEVPYAPYGYVVDHLDLATNQYVYKDLNSDGVVDAKDQQVIGNLEPKFIFGFRNEMSYHNFDLSFFFQGSVGNDMFVDAMSHMTTLNGNNNTLVSVYKQAGIKYRAPNADNGYELLDNNEVFDGTYVRLKELTFGYTLPSHLTQKMRLSNLRIYVTAVNLITFDNNYPWYDPETASGSDMIMGWDRGGYPNNKSIVVGLQVKF